MKLVVVLALLIAQLAQAQRGKLFKTTPAPPVEAKEAPSSSILNNKGERFTLLTPVMRISPCHHHLRLDSQCGMSAE